VTVKAKYKKLLALGAFGPTPATRQALKAALAMNHSLEERYGLAEAGARRAHARRKPKALAVA
jgi:hypothetical protein